MTHPIILVKYDPPYNTGQLGTITSLSYVAQRIVAGHFGDILHRLYYIFSIKLRYNLTTLCLNRTLSCFDFMDVQITGDLPKLSAFI